MDRKHDELGPGTAAALEEQLREARAQIATLEAEGRRKDEFFGFLAHQLRNVMTPLVSGVQILGRSRNAAVHATARQTIERQVWQTVRLVETLLDVSRAVRGEIELQRRHVDLAMLVESAITANLPLVEERGHQLSVSLPQVAVQVDADPERLTQVLSQLLSNAALYTPSGGQITLSGSVEGEEVVVRVIDTGVGIDAEALPGIFELFGHASAAPERGGLGVGLALAHRLVAMHGGSLEARSPGAGKGSTFSLRLPVLPPDPIAAPPPSQTSPGGMRILVVDDEFSARSLGQALELMGHEVKLASDGSSALAAATTDRPEAVLLGVEVPGLDGYQVAHTLRRRFPRGELLLVALSNWAAAVDSRRAREAGFDHHLVKPANPSELGALLSRFADEHHAPA